MLAAGGCTGGFIEHSDPNNNFDSVRAKHRAQLAKEREAKGGTPAPTETP